MNYLFIQGSPRLKGNTATALRAIAEGLSRNTPQENIVFLEANSLNIRPCQACDSCKKNGGFCIHSDDTNRVMDLIWDADFLIFGTPVYYWGVSSQIKLILDKLYSRNSALRSGPEKRLGLVTVGGSALDNPQYDLIDNQLNCIAEYLNWRHVFTNNYSAYLQGELAAQDGVLTDLKNLGAYLGHEHHH